MGQVTIYIDQETEAKMAAAAKSQNVSKSKWVATVINDKLANQWPASVANLAGSWTDFPTIEEIRHESHKDSPRETL